MLNQNKKWRNERGMALVIAILITSALVAVGSFAMVMTNTELDISKNDRFSKEAFFFTDGGGSIYTQIINELYWNNNVDQSNDAYTDITIDSNFLNEIMNYRTTDPALNDSSTDSPSNNPDITFVSNSNRKRLYVDIDWRARVAGPGGSLLTHMGYEGIGINKSFGGVQIYFDVNSQGSVGQPPNLANKRKLGATNAQVNSVYRR